MSFENNCGKTKENNDISKHKLDSKEEKLNHIVENLTENLTDTTPSDAVESFFEHKSYKGETQRGYESSLGYFVDWCELSEIEYMSDGDTDDIQRYRKWRRETAPSKVERLSPSSINTQMKRLRVFIKHCEDMKFVSGGVHQIINTSIDNDDEVRDEWVGSDKAEAMLDYLSKYNYASAEHVACRILCYTGMRLGSLHSIDVTDIQSIKRENAIHLEHRPEEGTTLKNGTDGERYIFITQATHQILSDYIDENRHDVTDDYGREPLVTSQRGRCAKSTLRGYIYKCTQPCMIGQDCPLGRDPESCDAAGKNSKAHECPEASSSHPLRKGYITRLLKKNQSRDMISARCDVSSKMIEKHYDMRSPREEMIGRCSQVKDVMSDF